MRGGFRRIDGSSEAARAASGALTSGWVTNAAVIEPLDRSKMQCREMSIVKKVQGRSSPSVRPRPRGAAHSTRRARRPVRLENLELVFHGPLRLERELDVHGVAVQRLDVVELLDCGVNTCTTTSPQSTHTQSPCCVTFFARLNPCFSFRWSRIFVATACIWGRLNAVARMKYRAQCTFRDTPSTRTSAARVSSAITASSSAISRAAASAASSSGPGSLARAGARSTSPGPAAGGARHRAGEVDDARASPTPKRGGRRAALAVPRERGARPLAGGAWTRVVEASIAVRVYPIWHRYRKKRPSPRGGRRGLRARDVAGLVNLDLESARKASRGRSKDAACVDGTGERAARCGLRAVANAKSAFSQPPPRNLTCRRESSNRAKARKSRNCEKKKKKKKARSGRFPPRLGPAARAALTRRTRMETPTATIHDATPYPAPS